MLSFIPTLKRIFVITLIVFLSNLLVLPISVSLIEIDSAFAQSNKSEVAVSSNRVCDPPALADPVCNQPECDPTRMLCWCEFPGGCTNAQNLTGKNVSNGTISNGYLEEEIVLDSRSEPSG